MSRTMEEYHQSNESEDNKGSWIWSKAVSVGKKVLTAGVVVSSAPLLVPSLFVASTIAFLSSVPFCLFLANYACTQKVMSSLLPDTEETGGVDKDDESGFDEYSKIGHREGRPAGAGEAALFMAADESIPIGVEEDEEMEKESTSLLEKIRDEGRTDKETSEKDLQEDKKSGNAKSEEVQDQPEKSETGREGELGATKTETSTGKDDEETSSNEVYSEVQIWEKMEALRKVVGYSVTRSASYAEELQALYVFTGVVEPRRSSLNQLDTHDIAHVSLRLRFLMSAIGII
ncbi:PREDICTED: uncharacterized protein LOC104701107 isoform X1 [Camelina sativa]|uniref:Uncharacterized protein LOC104701107 isoform X1 n=1 Tax=Camelina sativa TaxID=90675 RepID=A0ABM0SRF4_CAMSA|nr:PREDICTED: uncharacterized protein LOC104701107 isoform X1 [Camelina sativa]